MHDFLKERARLSPFWLRAYKAYNKLATDRKDLADKMLKRYVKACWNCDIPIEDLTIYEIVQEAK